MYTVKNFATKKALKEAVARGERVEVYQPGGLFPGRTDGPATVEGPHYPQPHSWYAAVVLRDSVIVKITR